MKEDIKNVLLMGLGAITLTGEKASEIKKELLEKGEALYKEGSIKNEELKRDIKEKIKDNTNIQYTSVTKDDLVDIISSMSDEEKAELTELLKSKKEDNTECKDEKCGCESSNDSEEEKQDENND